MSEIIKAEIIEERRGPGRPSNYSESMAELICDRLSAGESLRRICDDDDMPDRKTVFRWLDQHPEFATGYARARENQAENDHDKMIEIEHMTLKRKIDAKAANVVLGNMRWRMEKLKPKVFGASVKVEHSGKLSLESLVAGDAEQE